MNRLDAKNILHESKQSHDGFDTTARKNMLIVAPAIVADKLEWHCRNIEGKKIDCGCCEYEQNVHEVCVDFGRPT